MAFFESITDLWIEGQIPEKLSRSEDEDEGSFHRRLMFKSIMESSRIDSDGCMFFANQTFSIGDCRIHVRRKLKRFEFRKEVFEVIDISDCYLTRQDMENIQQIMDSANGIRIDARGSVIEWSLNLNWKRVDGFDARFSNLNEVRFNNTNFTDVVNLAHGKYGRLEGIDADFDKVIYFDFTNIDDLNLQGASGSRGMFFHQSRFRHLNMEYLKARDKINLSECVVQNAKFNSCDFSTPDFHDTRFGSVSFVCSVFREWTQFRNIECSKADFDGALFYGRTSMNDIHVGKVAVTNALFESGLSMVGAEFYEFQLSKSILRGTFQIGKCKGTKIIFDDCNIECEVTFESPQTDVSFRNASNSGIINIVTAKSVSLSGLRNNGKIYMSWEELEPRLVDDGFNPLLYRMLRENYRATGHPRDEEGVIKHQHEREMASIRSADLNLSRLKRYVILWILYKFGGFGIDPKRPFIASASVILLFALVYAAFLLSGSGFYLDGGLDGLDPLSSFFEGLIVSLFAFISLGFTSKIYPYTFDVGLIVGVEGFVAFFILTYYTVIITRKVTE